MVIGADFLVIGGGVAGLSAAARLAPHGRTILLEAEAAIGYHSSGRSATFSHYGIGDALVRALTLRSRSFFLEPPSGFSDVPLCASKAALFIASEAMRSALDDLAAEMARFSARIDSVNEGEMAALCPRLRFSPDAVAAGVVDRGGLKLDTHALLQGYVRSIRNSGGEISTGCDITSVKRSGGLWLVTDRVGRCWQAPILVNAAGAWADRVAALAGVRPLGLRALRRTIIVVDPPPRTPVGDWPFVKTATDDFYMLPEGGRIMASPVDEVPDEPCDAQPEEYDLALAADRLQHYTTLQVRRIAHRWAGLRTFTPNRVPVAGFAPGAPSFFWLAGQGGYGLQTAPAMALAAEALVTGSAWPAALREAGVEQDALAPPS